MPLTVGGGVASVEDARALLLAGADKVAINTAAIKSPNIVPKVAERFGSQCMVLSIQAKRQSSGWEAYYDNGREHSGLDAIEWAKRGESMGAGEILLTSVDQEGTSKGFDLDLIKAVTDEIDIPVIASGGMGNLTDVDSVVRSGDADAIAMAHVLHYGVYSVPEIRDYCIQSGIPVRRFEFSGGVAVS